MKVSCVEGLAIHDGPESCVGHCEESGEALTGESVGMVLSREKSKYRVPTIWTAPEGNIGGGGIASPHPDPARSETHSMHGSSMHGNREILRSPKREWLLGREGKA